jgi:hypothetical protein
MLATFEADNAKTDSARHLAKALLEDFNDDRCGDGTTACHAGVTIGRGRQCLRLHPHVILARLWTQKRHQC